MERLFPLESKIKMTFQKMQPRTLARFVRMIDLLASGERPVTLREASAKLKINKPSLFRLLTCMKEEGLAAQNGGLEGYTLGPKVLPWASSYLRNVSLLKLSPERIRNLRDKCNETVVLSMLNGLTRIVLAVEHPSRVVRTHINVGQSIPLPYGAAGKVITAFLDGKLRKELLSRPLKPLTETTISTPRALKEEIRQIQKHFLTVSKGERATETWAMASPIFDHKDQVIGSVAIVCPSYRYKTAKLFQRDLIDLY